MSPIMKRRRRSETDLRKKLASRSVSTSHNPEPCDLDDLLFKSPTLDMTPQRRRKRFRGPDNDTVSLQSVEMYPTSGDEPKKRRRSSLARVTSLSNLFSPNNIKSNIRPVKKIKSSLQKSLSLRSLMSPTSYNHGGGESDGDGSGGCATPSSASCISTNSHTPGYSVHLAPYKEPKPTPPKRRESTFWIQTVKVDTTANFSQRELDRQEAIFELYTSESDMEEDLKLLKTTYKDSMGKLSLLTPDELDRLFGDLNSLIQVHADLADILRQQRLPDGRTDCVGEVLVSWVPRLRCYIDYCSNQVYARDLLDTKKQDPAIDDFLQRCIDSPFSRRLDLWTFLDVPRSRLVKYPLLFKSIQKHCPPDHTDYEQLNRACNRVEEIISEVDKQTGKAKCSFTKEKLEYLDEKQRSPLIDKSEVILCDGVLKNNRGTKLHVFLLERVLLLTRPATRLQTRRYQVYRHPLAVDQIELEDLKDGQAKMGSFRSAFSQGSHNRNMFRITYTDPISSKTVSHTVQANDEHDKRQWITAIKSVLSEDNLVSPPDISKATDVQRTGKTTTATTTAAVGKEDSKVQLALQESHSTSSSEGVRECGEDGKYVVEFDEKKNDANTSP